jgi:D-serine deaminase-like pyridoxal phosphate-dependent protein
MATVFGENRMRVPIYIDLNVGQNRTGIDAGDKAIRLYQFCWEQKGIIPIGLHVYDGHLHQPDIHTRTIECDRSFGAVETMAATIRSLGYNEPVIVAGGTPTFPIHSKRKSIECSPGTFIYWDKGYLSTCSEQPFLNAAVLLARVISLPGPNKICIDLGHKSVAAENEIGKRIFFLNAPGLKFISQSEEHLVAETNPGHSFQPGDVLFGLPWHICPTVALYEKAYTIENNSLTGEWKTMARDRMISI